MVAKEHDLTQAAKEGDLEMVKKLADQLVSDFCPRLLNSELSDPLARLHLIKEESYPLMLRVPLLRIVQSIWAANQHDQLEVERYLCHRFQFKDLNEAQTQVEIYEDGNSHSTRGWFSLPGLAGLRGFLGWLFPGSSNSSSEQDQDPKDLPVSSANLGNQGKADPSVLREIDTVIASNDSDRIREIANQHDHLKPLIKHKQVIQAYTQLKEAGPIIDTQSMNQQLEQIWIPYPQFKDFLGQTTSEVAQFKRDKKEAIE